MTDLAWYHYPEAFRQLRESTGQHVMTLLHKQGSYRHLRFAEPGTMKWHFDLITWPGYLTIVGDIGSGFTFSRERDMLAFFDHGQPAGHINADYWAEKLVRAGRLQVLEYSEPAFVKHVRQRVFDLSEYLDDPDAASELRVQVTEEVLAHSWDEREAIHALDEFDFRDHRLDEDMDQRAWQDYNHHFVLACHAILWGAQKYRANT